MSSSSKDGNMSSRSLQQQQQRKQSIESESIHQSSSTTTTQDMDISPGDSTPTSETEQQPPSVVAQNSVGPVLLANALPRLISHPSK